MATKYIYESSDLEDAIIALAAEQDGIDVDTFIQQAIYSTFEQIRVKLRTQREQLLISQAGEAIAQGLTFLVSVDKTTGFPIGSVSEK